MLVSHRSPARVALILAACNAAGCGAGVVAVVASSGDSGGGGAPAITAFAVPDPKVSPAGITLEASTSLEVELVYSVEDGDDLPMDLVPGPGVSGNRVALAAGTNGVAWDFAADLGGTGLTRDVVLRAKRGGALVQGGELALLGMGNDAPVVESATPPPLDEVAGIAALRLRVSDSSGDAVSIRAEFDVVGDEPDAGWHLARPGGLLPGEPTPDFAFEGLLAPRSELGGVELDFFWNTDVDLVDLERDARLRFTARDPVVEGAAKETLAFRVDNNAPPIVQLDSGPLILNPDERRGIPIPFRVIDEEGDLVEVIFQWRREGEEFPTLDTDGDGKVENEEIDEIMGDVALRQEHHICSEYPHYAQGRVVPVDEDTVRLPELASSESWILAGGIVGKTLELLRPSSIPQPITPTWRSNPLVSPIAALPVGDGLTALVLDNPGQGRLREVELATGNVLREIATLGPGSPSTMAFERREKAVLVGLDDAGTWRIARVELATGDITELIVSDGTEPAPVRCIASLGKNAAVFTAGSSLFHLDYRDPLAPKLGLLLDDLATPWGVVQDQLPPDRIYISERDANRVLAVELDSHGKIPVVVHSADMQLRTLEAPEALALERHGSRVLIVTSASGGGRQLHGLDLGTTGGNRLFTIGERMGADVSHVTIGFEELRLLCIPSSNEILVAGGIEQERVIDTHTTSRQTCRVEGSFDPVPTPSQPWRIHSGQRLQGKPQGATGHFVWDSTDAPGLVFIRATPLDDDIGSATSGAAPKRVRGGLERDPVILGGPATTDFPRSIAAADLDGDGDQDLVSANSVFFPEGPLVSNLTVFFQALPGDFAEDPLTLGDLETTGFPHSVAAADLDGDGDQDLVSANEVNLTVFSQVTPGSFAVAPLIVGSPVEPSSVAAADLDGDGDQDLVTANFFGNNLTAFLQLAPGSFADIPLTLGSLVTTNRPVSVAAADLDGDGDLDLASANSFGHDLSAFFQVAPGGFAAAPLTIGSSATMLGPRAVAAADLDGDGDEDLVSANLDGDNLTVFLQLSPGRFAAAPLTIGSSTTTIGPRSVAAADLDWDGDQDLASANTGTFGGGNNLAVFFQLSPGSFASAPLTLGGPTTTAGPESVAAADLDGDGYQDLASANLAGNNLTVFLQLSPRSFATAPLILGDRATTDRPFSVMTADLDGNGDQDLVSANAGNNLTCFLQLSPGKFAAVPITLGASFPRSVAAADLDADGDQDLASANFGGDNLTVFFQLSPGSFADTPLAIGDAKTTNNPFALAAADLDADGDMDLVSANFSGSNLAAFFQFSPGNFTATPLILGGLATTDGPQWVTAGDLDGDGDQDLASANTGFFGGDENLTVFFQILSGSFAATPLTLGGSATTRGPFSVAAGDLDGDGDQDLVSANNHGSNLSVFFQLSPGSFVTLPLFLPPTNGPVSVVAADLDGDRDRDLVSANHGGNNLSVFFQLSPGRFAAAPLALGDPSTTNGPFSVEAGDLDGDGDQDLVSANVSGNNLTVFFGGR